MICQQAHVKTAAEVDAKIEPLKKTNPNLVFMFGSPAMFTPNGAAEKAAKAFGTATVIGCSTAGEITGEGVFDDSLAITSVQFKDAKMVAAQTVVGPMSDSFAAGERIGKTLMQPDLRGVFIVGPGVDLDGSALIEGLKTAVGSGDITITGGLAADQGKFQKTFTLLNGKTGDRQVAAIGFYGPSIGIAYGSMGGWEPFGISRKVTKARGNILFEIDGEPALAFYKRLLGRRAEGLPGAGLSFPFDVLDSEDSPSGIIRTILGVNEMDQSLVLAGDIEKAKWIRLMRATNEGLTGGATAAARNVKQLSGSKQGVGVLISCIGRKLVMGPSVTKEVHAVREVLGHKNVVGFYSNGEIAPQQGFQQCKLHNQTMTISYFYEA